MEIRLEESAGPAVSETDVEIVERKGLGHPDTICDAVMEDVARTLCRTYVAEFGRILHFNCDKGSLFAGQVELRLGGGRVLEPMRLVVGDRAATALGGRRIDVAALAVEASRGWFRRCLPRVDPERHVEVDVRLRPGSEELAAIFATPETSLRANDTSAAVGWAPLTETERLVLEAEHYLNSPEFRATVAGTGEDVKVMGVRTGRRLALTIAMPLLDGSVTGEADYFGRKADITDRVVGVLRRELRTLDDVDVTLNCLDRRGTGTAGMYLSVLGTSAEHGDSGEVGRGNGVAGFVSMHRPRGGEAAAGKNPVSHVGKIYSVGAHLLADAIHRRVQGLREVTVWMCSRIGEPVDRPWIVAVELKTERGLRLRDVAAAVRSVVEEQVARVPDLCRELAEGRHRIW